MIKGVLIGGMGKALSYLDKLTIPIIENTPHERDLKDSMAEVLSTTFRLDATLLGILTTNDPYPIQAMKKYPEAAGVLVRRHGVYVWGERSRRI